jgi:hypothetical protein
MNSEKNKIKFPLWQYLNQPLFNDEQPPQFNPRQFALIYRIELLKRCFERECDAKRQY